MRYEYVCPRCHWETEVKRSIGDRDKGLYCNRCGAPMKRKFGRGVIVVKGRGTYDVSFPDDWNKQTGDNDEVQK